LLEQLGPHDVHELDQRGLDFERARPRADHAEHFAQSFFQRARHLADRAQSQFARELCRIRQVFVKHVRVDGEKIPRTRGYDSSCGKSFTGVRAQYRSRFDQALATTVPKLAAPSARCEESEVGAVGVERSSGVLEGADFHPRKFATALKRDCLVIAGAVRSAGRAAYVCFLARHAATVPRAHDSENPAG